MKKSILILLSVLFVLILLFIIYAQLSKKENIEQKTKQVPKQTEIEKLSHLLPSGEIDYQYYYKYDRSMGCDYYLKDNNVYYMSTPIESAPSIIEMPKADIETFKVFDFLYAKDKNFAYYSGHIMNDADPATFEGIYSYEANGCPAEDGEASFATGFSKDKNNIYQYGDKVSILDSGSFEILGNRYIKTKDGIFILIGNDIKQILKADIGTFEIIKFNDSPSYVDGKYDAKDKNYKYKEGEIID